MKKKNKGRGGWVCPPPLLSSNPKIVWGPNPNSSAASSDASGVSAGQPEGMGVQRKTFWN